MLQLQKIAPQDGIQPFSKDKGGQGVGVLVCKAWDATGCSVESYCQVKSHLWVEYITCIAYVDIWNEVKEEIMKVKILDSVLYVDLAMVNLNSFVKKAQVNMNSN